MRDKTSHSSLIQFNKRKIAMAIDDICELYDVEKRHVLNPSSRKKPIPDARRMLIHYMVNQLEIKHYHIKDYLTRICHATSIYHCKKFDGYLEHEPQTRTRYLLFRKMAGEFNDKLLELEIKKDEIEKMQQEVQDILNELNQKDNGDNQSYKN